jgi:hypothetical protein
VLAWPMLTPAPYTAVGELTSLSCQRLHHALRRRVLERIFAASAPGADCKKIRASYEQLFRIATGHPISPGFIAQRRKSISAKV